MSVSHAKLRLIDENGEVCGLDHCPNCASREDEIKELLRRMRGMAHELAELRRDRDGEARASEYWPDALDCFAIWKDECHHPRSAWSAERFYLVLPYLRRKEHGKEKVLRAIAGAAYDPFVYMLKNGRQLRSDGWEKIFESVGRFEGFVNRCPLDWHETT